MVSARSHPAPQTALHLSAEKAVTLQTLLECVDLTLLAAMTTAAAREEIFTLTGEILKVSASSLPAALQASMSQEICDELLGLGPLEPLLARDDVTDIMVNGLNHCFIEAGGVLQVVGSRFTSLEHLSNICQRAAAKAGRRVDESSPICDARLADGSRINIIWPPLALDGPILTIRKFRQQPLTLANLTAFGTLSPLVRRLLELAVQSRCNILITGGSGSGKTTLLNALAGYIGEGERVVTCEDAAELRLQHAHTVRLESRPANFEGHGEIGMTALIRNALRMRPDRIVVGEVRGAEALDLLQAMNTGHDGSMGTLHANSSQQALSRLEALAMMGAARIPARTVRQLITGGVDLIIHVGRMADGARKLMQISEVDEFGAGLADMFRLGESQLCATPRLLRRAELCGLLDQLQTLLEDAPCNG
ncbi:MAG: CpaF family protein [Hyphomicrobiales bacterium]|nr:CpaF family protein [Hyphomicrobiales bacterium]